MPNQLASESEKSFKIPFACQNNIGSFNLYDVEISPDQIFEALAVVIRALNFSESDIPTLFLGQSNLSEGVKKRVQNILHEKMVSVADDRDEDSKKYNLLWLASAVLLHGYDEILKLNDLNLPNKISPNLYNRFKALPPAIKQYLLFIDFVKIAKASKKEGEFGKYAENSLNL